MSDQNHGENGRDREAVASQARRSRWLGRPRLRFGTWAALFFAAALLLAVEAAGRRSGITAYSHGLPFSFLERDYKQDPGFAKAAGYAHGLGPFSREWRDLEQNWSHEGFPLSLERFLDPWSLVATTSVHVWAIIVDLVAVAIIAGGVGWYVERRRRINGRPKFQFRLRTLLAVVTVTAICCSVVVGWHHGKESDEKAFADLQANNVLDRSGFADLRESFGWDPPAWLPDSIAKLGPFSNFFERIDSLRIETPSAKVLDQLERLPNLRRLTLSDNGPSGTALDHVVRMPSLEKLTINIDHYSASQIARLAALPRLKSLDIDGFAITNQVVAELNSLASLEELRIQRSRCTEIDLHGLRLLRELDIKPVGDHVEAAQPLWEVQQLPKEQQPADGFWHPVVRLHDLPALEQLYLEGAKLDSTGVRSICGLKGLQRLTIMSPHGNDPMLEFSDASSMRDLRVCFFSGQEIVVRDMPQLESMTSYANGHLQTMRFERLPRLKEIQIDSTAALASLALVETGALERLSISGSSEIGTQRPAAFAISGLKSPKALHSLGLADRKIDQSLLSDLSRLTTLESLDLSGTWLADEQFSQLGSLVNLRSLNLSGTDLSSQSVKTLKELPLLESLTLTCSSLSEDDPELATFLKARPLIACAGNGTSSAITLWEAQADSVREGRNKSVGSGWTRHGSNWPNANGGWDLSASKFYITNSNLHCLDDLNGLTDLDLSFTHVTDEGLPTVVKHSSLRSLNLQRTHVTDSGLRRLRQLKSLESLSVAETDITGDGVKVLSESSSLKSLDLSGCKLTNDDLAELINLPTIDQLWLADAPISDAGLAHIANLRHLRLLSLAGTNVSNEGLSRLAALTELQSLDLSRSAVSRADLKRLCALPHLQTLALGGCKLRGEDLAALVEIPALTRLDLSDVESLDSTMIKRLAFVKNIQVLHLGVYPLTDAEAMALAKMPSLKEVSFNGQKITGDAIKALAAGPNGARKLIIWQPASYDSYDFPESVHFEPDESNRAETRLVPALFPVRAE